MTATAIGWIEPDWPAPAHLRVLSTLRGGGTSTGPYASLNLAAHVGDDPRSVAANRLLLKNIDVAGFFLGGYSMYQNPMVHEAQDMLYGLFRTGKLTTVIYKEYPFADLPMALDDLQSRQCYGKPILLPE